MYLCVFDAVPQNHGNRAVKTKVLVDHGVHKGHVADCFVIQASVVSLQNLLNFLKQSFLQVVVQVYFTYSTFIFVGYAVSHTHLDFCILGKVIAEG